MPDRASSAVITIPNLLSFLRILMIPVFVALIVHRPTTTAGLILFAVVAATDWVDGWVARRTGQVSELGKLLDPTADRLAIAAGLIALVVRDVFPLWAALLILVRDAAILIAGASVLASKRIRLEVRFIGKVATFMLMMAIPWIAWGNLGLPLADAALVVGWVSFAVGIVEYYVAAGAYIGDIRRALAASS
ncbi:MAG: CDP-alcohol phosphatidyltransferase family protein [Actinomycetota bacterium]